MWRFSRLSVRAQLMLLLVAVLLPVLGVLLYHLAHGRQMARDFASERVRLLADREHVGQNELVRYLLTWSLSQIESGKHRLPAEPVEKRTLGV